MTTRLAGAAGLMTAAVLAIGSCAGRNATRPPAADRGAAKAGWVCDATACYVPADQLAPPDEAAAEGSPPAAP